MKIDGDMAELLGIHIGDGCISRTSRYAEYYLGGDITEEKEYHDKWVAPLFNKKVMIPLYKRKVTYKEHPKVGVYGFHIFNEKVVKFYEGLGIKSGSKIKVKIPEYIIKNTNHSKRFLRGLFDTDGTIYFDKNYSAKNPINNKPRIKVDSVSKDLILQVYLLLKKLGFNPRLRKEFKSKRNLNTFYGVIIDNIKDIDLFLREIGFKNSKHYTKWKVFKILGYCPPYTTLLQRKEIISKNL